MKRLWLLLALLAGKALDSVSTVVVLPLSENFYESVAFSRALIAEFGLVGGMAVSVVVAVCVVALLAESGAVVERVAPAEWVPDWYARSIRVGTYLVAATWYALVGVQNVMLAV